MCGFDFLEPAREVHRQGPKTKTKKEKQKGGKTHEIVFGAITTSLCQFLFDPEDDKHHPQGKRRKQHLTGGGGPKGGGGPAAPKRNG